PADSQELRITRTGWAVVKDGVESPVALAADGIQTREANKPNFTQLEAYAAPLKSHDWVATPKLTLGDVTTLEKTDAGYVLRRSEDAGVTTSAYTLTYHRLDPADSDSVITVSVVGMV